MDLRKIDALIAEQVMGWRWWTRFGWRWFGPSNTPDLVEDLGEPVFPCEADQMDDKVPEKDWWLTGKNAQGFPVVPHYSTDPAAAKQVREKLAEKFDIWELTRVKSGAFRFVVLKVGNEYTAEKWGAFANTEELAICLTALKSAGVEPVLLPEESQEKVSGD